MVNAVRSLHAEKHSHDDIHRVCAFLLHVRSHPLLRPSHILNSERPRARIEQIIHIPHYEDLKDTTQYQLFQPDMRYHLRRWWSLSSLSSSFLLLSLTSIRLRPLRPRPQPLLFFTVQRSEQHFAPKTPKTPAPAIAAAPDSSIHRKRSQRRHHQHRVVSSSSSRWTLASACRVARVARDMPRVPDRCLLLFRLVVPSLPLRLARPHDAFLCFLLVLLANCVWGILLAG